MSDEIPLVPLPSGPKPKSVKPALGVQPPAASAAPRRGFFVKGLAVVIGGLVGVVPALAGLVVFLDPLRRRGTPYRTIRVTALDALPNDGSPRGFPIVADRDDAWNRFVNEPIGRVFLRRLPGTSQVQAFNATCPHAGCFVDFKHERNQFRCPCHTSGFEVDGQRVMPCVAPRGLDELECEIRTQGGMQTVFVKFANFYTGVAEKKVKA